MPRIVKAILILCILTASTAQAGTSRAMPLAYTVSTYSSGSPGCLPVDEVDYSGLAVWESATRGDLVTAQSGEVLYITPGVHIESDGFSMACGAGNTNADYFRVMMAQPGQEPLDEEGWFYKTAAISFWGGVTQAKHMNVNTEDYASFYDLAIDAQGLCWSAALYIADSANVRVVGCIFNGVPIPGACGYPNNRINHIELYRSSRTTSAIIVNNFFYGLAPAASAADAASIYMGLGGDAVYLYNNTFYANARPAYWNFSDNPVVLCTNNIRYGNTSDDYADNGGGLGTGEYTVTTDATSGIVFVDADDPDLHILRSSTGAVNQGTDLTADAVFPFNDDIDGATRPTGEALWDIGADEATGLRPWQKVIQIF